MFTSLKRITYQVSDLVKAKEWYSYILNTKPHVDSPKFVIFLIGDNSLTLIPGFNDQNNFSSSIFPYWEVNDFDQAYNAILKAGAEKMTDIQIIGDIKFATVVDPFGNIVGLTGTTANSDKKTIKKESSSTAKNIAICRALAFLEDRVEIKGEDYLAELFLDKEMRENLKNEDYRTDLVSKNMGISMVYGYMIARTRFLDTIFKKSLEENIDQIILFGAGYDSRPYRFSKKISDTKLFEIDAAKTQNEKIQILKNNSIPIPDQLKYIPMNFEIQNIKDELLSAGFSTDKKSLYIMEGLIYYLNDNSVNDLFTFINANSSDGSIIAFDYLNTQVDSIHSGEPFKFWIESNKISEFLSRYNFSINEHLDALKIEKDFLTLKDGTLAENGFKLLSIVKATKP